MALRPAERGLVDDIPEGEEQHRGNDHDDELLQRHGNGAEMIAFRHHRRDRLVARTLRHLDEVGQRDRHADGRDQRCKTEGASERAIGDAFDHPVPQAGHQHGDDHHQKQKKRHRNAGDKGCHDQENDQRGKAAEHENIAVGEVDHADDAVNHRIADSDEAVDRSKSQPVDELLDKILHVFPPGTTSNGPRLVMLIIGAPLQADPHPQNAYRVR